MIKTTTPTTAFCNSRLPTPPRAILKRHCRSKHADTLALLHPRDITDHTWPLKPLTEYADDAPGDTTEHAERVLYNNRHF